MLKPTPRLSVFGLGYVGSVTSACFANEGRKVLGVDRQQTKVDLINAGRAPIIEADLEPLLVAGLNAGRLAATTESGRAIADSDISIVCVGTPSRPNGSLDLRAVEAVCAEIGAELREKSGFHVVVIRSTVLPGTIRETVQPILEEASGKRAGIDFGLAHNPEFLRESTAVHDFNHPPKTVVGASDDLTADLICDLYGHLDAPLIRTSIDVAEMVKYADNSWHALKVAFGNEIGNIAKALGIDSHEVMSIFCQDTKLNLSPYYLRPGFAFGGSCLPKDLRAITYRARSLDVDVPVLSSILPSNRLQVERCLQRITAKGCRKIGILGFSFKAGTDDLRESPVVELIERLIGKGFDLRLYDKNVRLARLVGANRDYIMNAIPHISRLMVDTIDEVVAHADLVVVGNNDPDFTSITERLDDRHHLVDLVRIGGTERLGARYDGINW